MSENFVCVCEKKKKKNVKVGCKAEKWILAQKGS